MNQLVRNRNMVDALASAVRGGSESLGQVPGLLCRVIEEEAWQHFTTALGKEVSHARLADFITTPPLDGLGASIDLVRKIIGDDVRALDLLDQALQNPPDIHTGVNNINASRPQGTRQEQALRRLRKDAPELHAEVLAGTLSAHGAMVKAGYRPKTVSVPVSKPESVAAYLRKHMSRESLLRLIELLIKDDE